VKDEKKWMKIALSLAKKGEGKVSPNPMVGAVLVKDGQMVGKGYHRYFGGPHAEIEAINQAKEKAKGSTLFVSLEPCSHFGKTPPCTQTIIKTNIKKVVAATIDPNPLNKGKGIKTLEEVGIEVKVGVCEQEAKKVNQSFFKLVQEKIPFVIIKAAISLDGKIATSTNESKWITGERARLLGKKLRGKVDAILVGINTVIKDNPELLPLRAKERYLRIILDTKLRIPLEANILKNQKHYPTLIFTGAGVDPKKIKVLKEKGVEVKILKSKEQKINTKKVLKELGKRKIASLLVEGGGEVIASFVKENLVDKIYLFLSPCIIGGRNAPTWVEGEGFSSLQDALRVKIEKIRRVDEDILIEGYPAKDK